MKLLTNKRCIIGEGPIWNEREQKLYFTNGFGNEICTYDLKTDKLSVRSLPFGVSAFAFDINNRLIVSHADGVHILNDDDSLSPIYDNTIFEIKHANDMKVGPDGAIYVGTQSEKRKGISDNINGKLYRISPGGNVKILLDGLLLSNGMEWSIDETKFYHTDSDTQIITEYVFDKTNGTIKFSGRQISVPGVDGFTIGKDGCLYVGCWGGGHIAIVGTATLKICDYLKLPTNIPTSCAFCGENMTVLAITPASYTANLAKDEAAGFTLLTEMKTKGRHPYLFGAK